MTRIPKDVTLEVEHLVMGGATYLDAIVSMSEKYEVDVEDIVPRLSSVLIHKLEVECVSSKLVRGVDTISLESL